LRLHVLGLPHTQTTARFAHCAFTQLVIRFCGMMLDEGHEVYLYSGEENEARCTEHVALLTEKERIAEYGEWDPQSLGGQVNYSPEAGLFPTMAARAVKAIHERAQPRDTLCLTVSTQATVARELDDVLPVEWTVGYEWPVLERCVFPSYAWMHFVYGRQQRAGRYYDTVIPHPFDPAEFPTGTPSSDPYLLFIGRLTALKGPHVAVEIAKAAGMRLVVAGPGAVEWGDGFVTTADGMRLEGALDYVGSLGVRERAEVMGGAAATIVPTQYVEPFGLVAVESMACGTPVIASDWGAFVETVREWGGHRFRTLDDAVRAVESVREFPRELVAAYAHANYSTDVIGPQYTAHFERLTQLWDDGWYSRRA